MGLEDRIRADQAAKMRVEASARAETARKLSSVKPVSIPTFQEMHEERLRILGIESRLQAILEAAKAVEQLSVLRDAAFPRSTLVDQMIFVPDVPNALEGEVTSFKRLYPFGYPHPFNHYRKPSQYAIDEHKRWFGREKPPEGVTHFGEVLLLRDVSFSCFLDHTEGKSFEERVGVVALWEKSSNLHKLFSYYEVGEKGSDYTTGPAHEVLYETKPYTMPTNEIAPDEAASAALEDQLFYLYQKGLTIPSPRWQYVVIRKRYGKAKNRILHLHGMCYPKIEKTQKELSAERYERQKRDRERIEQENFSWRNQRNSR